MKKLFFRKKLEVFLLILVIAAFVAAVFLVPGFFTAIAQDYRVMISTGLLALTLLFAFIFLLSDLAFLAKKSREFYPLNGIETERGKKGKDSVKAIDSLMASYRTTACPDDLTCILFTLHDQDGNSPVVTEEQDAHGHQSPIFRRFTAILKLTAPEGCLLGRNEQGRWLAVIEHASPEETDYYLERIKMRVEANNDRFPRDPIFLQYALVRQSELHASNIAELLAQAEKKINETPAAEAEPESEGNG